MDVLVIGIVLGVVGVLVVEKLLPQIKELIGKLKDKIK